MGKKILDLEKNGMVVCQSCMGKGFVLKLKRQRCPNCGGFGFIKKEAKGNNISTSNPLNVEHILDEDE